MSLILWILSYLALAVFWLWIIRWGGAEWMEGKFVSGFLVHMWAVTWTAEGIKVFAWGLLIINTIIFILGIFFHSVRSFGFFST